MFIPTYDTGVLLMKLKFKNHKQLVFVELYYNFGTIYLKDFYTRMTTNDHLPV